MHVGIGKRVKDVRHVFQPWPVELNVLARGEMSVSLVPSLGDVCQLPELPAVQGPVWNCDPQHVGVQLQVQAIHEAKRLEFVLGQGAVDPPPDLVAKPVDPVTDKSAIELRIPVHVLFPGLFPVRVV